MYRISPRSKGGLVFRDYLGSDFPLLEDCGGRQVLSLSGRAAGRAFKRTGLPPTSALAAGGSFDWEERRDPEGQADVYSRAY